MIFCLPHGEKFTYNPHPERPPWLHPFSCRQINPNQKSIPSQLLPRRGPLFTRSANTCAPTFHTVLASTEEQIQAAVHDPGIHGIVFDLDCISEGAADGIEVLQEIRKLREDVVLVAITESSNSEIPLKASQAGADEFFLDSMDFSQLAGVLLGAIEKRALQFEGRWLLDQVESKSAFCGLIGGSEGMQKVYGAIQAVADSNASVLLRGESGVGKELVAHAIVQSGNRQGKPFVCLNCSALPESLIESELFGYERGAFTGAEGAKPGLIEMAHGGTLFLDEITTLNHPLQSKLLRILQDRSVQRLGGRSSRKIDFRLITATNDDLEDMMQKGRFREDLYYRINVVPILIPPLRERMEMCRCSRNTSCASTVRPTKSRSSSCSPT